MYVYTHHCVFVCAYVPIYKIRFLKEINRKYRGKPDTH